MSIIINALNKSDTQKNGPKKVELKKLLGIQLPSVTPHKRGFWLGMLAGFAAMICVLLSIIMWVLFRPSSPDIARVGTPKPVDELAQIDQEIKHTDTGLDIEDELSLEEFLNNRKPKVATHQPLFVRNIPVENKIETLSSRGLPELLISGVVRDFTTRYVFINGIPYQEDDVYKNVKIKKIALNSIRIEYKNKTYKIVLK